MCNPMMAVMAITAVAGYQQQKSAAKAQVKHQEAMGKAAMRDAAMRQEDLNLQADQESDAATEAALDQTIAAAEATSAARVSAGEAGVSGAGVNRLVGKIKGQESRNAAMSLKNMRASNAARNAQREGVQAGLEGSLNQARTEVDSPGLGSLALDLGTAYMTGTSMNKQAGLNDFSTMFETGELYAPVKSDDIWGVGDLGVENLSRKISTG
eukprot:GHVR01011165.1.p1 GENE.GHVR01011165.1~~GHVR01011165.1.p1  ORF type:complete len:211 (-),score=47.91 GHVR01011165.1:34-666(-)